MSGAIPTNWKMMALSQIAEIRLGKMLSAKAREDGLIQRPYLRNENVRWGTVDLSDLKVMGFKPEEIERYSVQSGDLVICEGGEAGRCAVYRGSTSVMYQKAIHRLRPSPGVVTAEFLQAAFEYGITSNRWFPRFSETTIQHLPLEKIKAVEIPIPPPKEQQRIVAALDERLSELDASVASLERAERNLVRYRAAVLAAACSGKLVPTEAELAHRAGRSFETADQLLARILAERRKANTKAKYEEPAQPDIGKLPKLPEGWAWASPEQLTSDDPYALAIGPFGSNLKVSDYTDSGIRLVFVRNITQESFTDAKAKYVTEVKAKELIAHRVLPGDILITKMGDPPGDACLYPDHLSPGIITSDCIRLSPRRTHLSTRYLLYAVRSRFVQQQILAITKGVAQLKVSLGRFCSIVIPLPPLAEQERIVAEVDRHLSRADALAVSIAQSKRRAQRLRRTILAAAFQGRLVPQDPNDEPASVLLDRIRAQMPPPGTARGPRASTAAPERASGARSQEIASPTTSAMTPKRRGRPPGSKNKAKA